MASRVQQQSLQAMRPLFYYKSTYMILVINIITWKLKFLIMMKHSWLRVDSQTLQLLLCWFNDLVSNLWSYSALICSITSFGVPHGFTWFPIPAKGCLNLLIPPPSIDFWQYLHIIFHQYYHNELMQYPWLLEAWWLLLSSISMLLHYSVSRGTISHFPLLEAPFRSPISFLMSSS